MPHTQKLQAHWRSKRKWEQEAIFPRRNVSYNLLFNNLHLFAFKCIWHVNKYVCGYKNVKKSLVQFILIISSYFGIKQRMRNKKTMINLLLESFGMAAVVAVVALITVLLLCIFANWLMAISANTIYLICNVALHCICICIMLLFICWSYFLLHKTL